MTNLTGKVALVTGATYGVGRGVALELAEAGVTVYATGRSITKEAFATDGIVIPVRCDHTRDSEVEAVFHQITNEQDRLDILVNSVWGGYENMVENGEFTWMVGFWEERPWGWGGVLGGGVGGYYVGGGGAGRLMVAQQSGV